ncbi:MAG: D-alanyl-D-alanine carboxypeptidase/D-alanyl-D-alanine-endopeptidase [Aquisalimonadaceae bacterium]
MHRRMRPVPVLFISLWVATVSSASPALPEHIAEALQKYKVDRADVSIRIQPVGSAEPLLDVYGDVPRNPASVTKLPVSFAALERLSPAYTWKTEIYADTEPRDGVLAGDLWFKGYGDPYLMAEEFWKLAGMIRRAGIRRIDGDLVFDTSHFAIAPEDPGAFDNKPYRAYNQSPHPLLVNFNVVRFHLRPDNGNGQISVVTDPPLPGLQLDNRVRLGGGPCVGYQRGVSYHLSASEGVVLEGLHPASCNGVSLTRVAVPPEDYAYQLFQLLWQQWGGEFHGGWRQGERPADDREPLVVHHSRPLGDLIRLANKYSSNVMTRHFKLALAAARHGAPATETGGNLAILELLEERGVDTRGVVLDNAAGLSRGNRFTARQIAQVLDAAWHSPYMPEFVSSLSLSGLDGTLRRRFQDPPEAGRMHLKTGRLDHVSTIAGYVRTPAGRDLIVVVMVNAEDAHRGSGDAIQDAALRWAFRQ